MLRPVAGFYSAVDTSVINTTAMAKQGTSLSTYTPKPIEDDGMITERKLMEAYIDMAMERITRGFVPYLVTLMFNPMGGSTRSRQALMQQETERLYARLLTRTFRKPEKQDIADLPLWISASDWPVQKKFKDHLFNIMQNDGEHMHSIALQPPISRMKEGLLNYVDDNQPHIHGPERAFQRVRVDEITETPRKAIGYALKSLPRKRIDAGEVLILPRTHSEMAKLTPYERDQQRRDANERKAARSHAAFMASKAR
ncbi:hypothetical protein AKG11_33545 [Shinella sp. SUS2]|nr:hypothetical protein AKG11_33545 [Shinella sp. SUS2]KOC71382.1 hypothetical protein AKG10_33425 [Shinella sp. GWS1]